MYEHINGLELGADAYFTKPYQPAELIAQINAIFRLAERRTSSQLICGDLVLSPEEKIVMLNGRTLNLTTIEYDLLELFMRNIDKVFGRSTLLRKVWGYDDSVTTRTVDTHIQRLRTKIEADSSNPERILTVRGFGYRLINPEA